MKRALTPVVFVLALSTAYAASRADWTQFRGPGGGAVSDDAKLPIKWSTKEHVRWKVELPGSGWSCPIVVGDKVFVTAAVSSKPEQRPARGRGGPGGGGFGGGGFGGRNTPPDDPHRFEIHCLDRASGSTLWTKVAREGKPTIPKHGTNTYASETPVSDGERVYAYFGMVGVYCYDLQGNKLWEKDLGVFPMQMGWGTGSSPALEGELLFIQCDNEQQSFLVALDKMTGEEKWRVERDEKSSWSSPFVWRNKERTELVVLGRTARSHDPRTGEVLWELAGLNGRCNATPVADEERLYLGGGGRGGMGGGRGGPGGPGGPGGAGRPGGRPPAENGSGDGANEDPAPDAESNRSQFQQQGGRGQPGGRGFGGGGVALIAIRAGAKGKLSLADAGKESSGVAWHESKGGPTMASPLLYKGYLYVVDQRGSVLNCFEAATGKAIYQERLPDAGGFTSSPWASQDHLYFLDGRGQTFVVKAGPKFEVVAENNLDENCWSSPALDKDAILLRTAGALYSLEP